MTSAEHTLTEELRILEFLNATLHPTGKPVTDVELNLIEAGVIDSVGILELVVFLDEAFGVRVEQESLSPENFHSVVSVAGFVRRTLGRS